MSYYPPGAFDAMLAIEKQQEKHEADSIKRAEELKDAATADTHVCYTAQPNKPICVKPSHLVEDWIDTDAMREAIRYWLAGDMNQCAAHINAAFEIGFEQAVDFLATCDINSEDI